LRRLIAPSPVMTSAPSHRHHPQAYTYSRMAGQIFMKFGVNVMPLVAISSTFLTICNTTGIQIYEVGGSSSELSSHASPSTDWCRYHQCCRLLATLWTGWYHIPSDVVSTALLQFFFAFCSMHASSIDADFVTCNATAWNRAFLDKAYSMSSGQDVFCLFGNGSLHHVHERPLLTRKNTANTFPTYLFQTFFVLLSHMGWSYRWCLLKVSGLGFRMHFRSLPWVLQAPSVLFFVWSP
jgi:hypothetical protein